MKAKAILICLGLISIALGAQDSVHFSRHLKEGQQVVYKMHITGSTPGGDLDFGMKLNEVVKKLYDNGDADVLTTVSDWHISMGGNDMPYPAPVPSTVLVDKNGTPKAMPDGVQGKLQLMQYLADFFDKDVKVGDTLTINTTDPKDAKNKTTGTVKFESVTDGVAKISGDLTRTWADTDTPSKIKVSFYVNVGTSTVNKLEGTVDSIPLQQGFNMTDVKINMEHLAS